MPSLPGSAAAATSGRRLGAASSGAARPPTPSPGLTEPPSATLAAAAASPAAGAARRGGDPASALVSRSTSSTGGCPAESPRAWLLGSRSAQPLLSAAAAMLPPWGDAPGPVPDPCTAPLPELCLGSALSEGADPGALERSAVAAPIPRASSADRRPPAPLLDVGEPSGDAAIACWRSLRGSTAAFAGGAPRGGRPTGGAPRGGGPDGTLPPVGGAPLGGGPRGGAPAGTRDISPPCVDAMSQVPLTNGERISSSGQRARPCAVRLEPTDAPKGHWMC